MDFAKFIEDYNQNTDSNEVLTDDIRGLLDSVDRIGGDYTTYLTNHPYVLADAAKEYIIAKAADAIDGIKKEFGGIVETQRKAIAELKKEKGSGGTSIAITIDGKKLKTQTDEILHDSYQEILTYVTLNEPVYLYGPAGTGKSHIAQQVAKTLDVPFYFQNCIYLKSDIEGYCDAYGVYHATPFYEAFKNGGVYMLDELDASIPEAVNALNTAIANKIFSFPEGKDREGNPCGGLVKAHENFRVIAAGNTIGMGADATYTGRNQLDGATLNRFGVVSVDYDPRIEAAMCPDAILLEFCRLVRKAVRETGLPMVVSYRELSRCHKLRVAGLSMAKIMMSGLFKQMPKDDILTILGGIQTKDEEILDLVDDLKKTL